MNDPDDAAAKVRDGDAAIQRGEYIDIDGDAELKAYFESVRARAKKELAAEKETPTTCAEVGLEDRFHDLLPRFAKTLTACGKNRSVTVTLTYLFY